MARINDSLSSLVFKITQVYFCPTNDIFQVPMYSIHDFTKTLLEGLQFWADVSELHYTAEKVLEFSFLERDEIYLRYFRMSTNRWEPIPHERSASTIFIITFLIRNLKKKK